MPTHCRLSSCYVCVICLAKSRTLFFFFFLDKHPGCSSMNVTHFQSVYKERAELLLHPPTSPTRPATVQWHNVISVCVPLAQPALTSPPGARIDSQTALGHGKHFFCACVRACVYSENGLPPPCPRLRPLSASLECHSGRPIILQALEV